MPADKQASFDRGYAASAREAGYEVRSLGGHEDGIEYDGGQWWRFGPHGIEVIPSVPERPW